MLRKDSPPRIDIGIDAYISIRALADDHYPFESASLSIG
jgi:hypothetical protein